MRKEAIESLREKNRIIANIIEAMVNRGQFLLMCHRNPDEDCIASVVAFSLLLNKFNKHSTIYLGHGKVQEQYEFLLKICRYNSIEVVYDSARVPSDIDTVVVCDTPKPDLLEADDRILEMMGKPEVVKVEIDHHLGGDSEYIGDRDYALVMEASSSCELVGHITLRLGSRKDILDRFQISDLFSRNISLAILTGLVGESGMGKFLKTRREQRYYRIFSTIFNNLLKRQTNRPNNLSEMDEVYRELHRLSSKEEKCFNFMMEFKQFSPSIGYVVLQGEQVAWLHRNCDDDTIISVSRAVANSLAEESRVLSLVVVEEEPGRSELVQFRLRRSTEYKDYDLREVLNLFSIENGGGHEGAIAFRIPHDRIPDLPAYVATLVQGVEDALATVRPPAVPER